MKKKILHIGLILLFLPLLLSLFSACESELKPPPEEIFPAYVSGKIFYKGGVDAWADSSEVKAIRVGLFKSANPIGLKEAVIDGDAYITFFSLPTHVAEAEYIIEIKTPPPPVELKYLVVALQYTDSLADQRIVAVYNTSGDANQPSSLSVKSASTITNINFYVDFDNLPKQPF